MKRYCWHFQLGPPSHYSINIDMMMQDEVIELSSDSDCIEVTNAIFEVTIPGKPLSMPRAAFMAWMRNNQLLRRVVNRAKPKMKLFREKFLQQLFLHYKVTATHLPLIPVNGIVMVITFCRRLSNEAFQRNDRRQPLRGGYQRSGIVHADTKKPDIDNLAKFVMDSLNGVVYRDDAQVVKTTLYKVVDKLPPYEGRTVVQFHEVDTVRDLERPRAERIPRQQGVIVIDN